MKNSFELIYDVVRRIPRGKVATYGQIAMLAGNPRWSRVVGYALHVNPDPAHIPCYRVVNRLGEPSRADIIIAGGRRRIHRRQSRPFQVPVGRETVNLKNGTESHPPPFED